MNRPRRILILSDGFSAPAYKPRLRSLCDRLSKHGWQLTVICEKADKLNFQHEYPIYEVALYRGKGIAGKIDWAVKNCLSLLLNWKEKAFSRKVQHLIKGQQFDVVYCTSFHTFPLHTANRIARSLQVRCVVDIRDLVEQAPSNTRLYLAHNSRMLKPVVRLFTAVNLRRRNRELALADAVTTVSPWHVEQIKKYNPNVFLVYNGYDDTVFVPKDKPTDIFRIVYTGKVFPKPQQDATLLFQALKQLPQTIQVDWYIDPRSQRLIEKDAEKYGVKEKMNYKGQVSVSMIPEILAEASVVLVLTNKAGSQSGHGKMTTKFFEALGVEKPVLCVTGDEECLEQVIVQTNAGLSAHDAGEVVEFISSRYEQWLQNGFTRQSVCLQEKEKFSRSAEALLTEKLLLKK